MRLITLSDGSAVDLENVSRCAFNTSFDIEWRPEDPWTASTKSHTRLEVVEHDGRTIITEGRGATKDFNIIRGASLDRATSKD